MQITSGNFRTAIASWTLMAAIAAFPVQVAAQEPEIVVRVGHNNPPDSAFGLDIEMWSELVDVNSNGRIKIEQFPSGLLGSSSAQVEGLITGTQDVFMQTSSFTGMVKEQSVWDLPFLFNDRKQVIRVTQGPLRAEIEEQFRSKGLEVLAFWDLGFRQIAATTKPIEVPADIQGLTYRASDGSSKARLIQSLGGNPTTIAWPELYQALRLGVVEAMDADLDSYYTSKMYEVTNYLSVCNLVYNPTFVVAGGPFWEKLPDWAKHILKQSARDVEGASLMRGSQAQDTLIRQIKEAAPNLKVNECSPENQPVWQEASKVVYDSFVDDVGAEWLNRVRSVANGGYVE